MFSTRFVFHFDGSIKATKMRVRKIVNLNIIRGSKERQKVLSNMCKCMQEVEFYYEIIMKRSIIYLFLLVWIVIVNKLVIQCFKKNI